MNSHLFFKGSPGALTIPTQDRTRELRALGVGVHGVTLPPPRQWRCQSPEPAPRGGAARPRGPRGEGAPDPPRRCRGRRPDRARVRAARAPGERRERGLRFFGYCTKVFFRFFSIFARFRYFLWPHSEVSLSRDLSTRIRAQPAVCGRVSRLLTVGCRVTSVTLWEGHTVSRALVRSLSSADEKLCTRRRARHRAARGAPIIDLAALQKLLSATARNTAHQRSCASEGPHRDRASGNRRPCRRASPSLATPAWRHHATTTKGAAE